VQVCKNNAIVCFYKFGTIGIGFQIEKRDRNTNLPYTCNAKEIYDHIKINRGCNVSEKKCIEAIKLLQRFCADKAFSDELAKEM
jgi:hypothetical protein